MESLGECASEAHRLAKLALCMNAGLDALNLKSYSAHATRHACVTSPMNDAISRRLAAAKADVAAAELALHLRNFRKDWEGFVDSVDELIASLEAAPLLEVCPA
jgi:hypothetical protein